MLLARLLLLGENIEAKELAKPKTIPSFTWPLFGIKRPEAYLLEQPPPLIIVPFLVPVAAIFNEFVGLKQHFGCAFVFVFAGTLEVAFIYIYIYIEEVGIQMPLLYLLKSKISS